MDKMTDARFEELYATALNGRFLGLEKRLPKSVDYYQWIRARQRLAPIERLQFRCWLHTYTETVSHRVRRVYSIRKGWKRIGTVNALKHFRGIE
jgi:hypothetical protein